MTTPDLTNPQQLISLLQKHRLYTQKKFGQNFLINRSVITSSIEAANISKSDVVVEIGVGTGVLTQQLALKAKTVNAFEIDAALKPLLTETLAGFNNIQLYFQDFKQANLTEILSSENDKRLIYKVVANLPYNAGTHIVGKLIQLPFPPQSITVLLQKEVAQKITASTPHATYLSNFIGLYGEAEIISIVPPTSFFPAPKVESAILHIEQHPQPIDRDLDAISGFLHRGFANPRKKINKAFPIELLEESGIDSNLRPENIRLEEWLKLFAISRS